MSQLNTTELFDLRQRPHYSKLWLSIFTPQTLFQTRLVSVSSDNLTLVYSGTLMGTSTGTDFNGVTMWVGSTPGASDIGEIRVKYLTGTSIGVPLNDGIPWTAGQYLTLTNFREIWPIYASYVPNANLSDIILSIDGTINYTNQNANMGAFNCMGCGYAGFIGDQIFLNASGTMSVVDGRTISSYVWNCPGATPSAVTGSVGTISYPTAGFYVVRLTTVDSAGVPTISYRHFSIYDHQNNPPIGQWGLDNLASSTSDILKREGGYSGEIWVRQILPNIDDGALVTIFAEEEDFGTDQRSIGGRIGRKKTAWRKCCQTTVSVTRSQ